ncbi:MAG: response regulator [Calothrix sp. MO_192.B10]|nr:response regulator [Calothrix sp. MO_192.B10]
MNHHETMGANNFIDEFHKCTQLQYNGQLKIESQPGKSWTFYYRLGRIVWASGGDHPYRRWRRYMMQYCPGVNIEKISCSSQELSLDYWDYNLLEKLYAQQKISREQINLITEHCISELLFDIRQQANFQSISCRRNQDIILEAPMSFTSADMSLKEMEESWTKWTEAGLTNFSPNLAPLLRKPEQLKQHVSSNVYQNFVKLMNGKYALRDLAFIMKQTVLPVTRSLLPYILKGIIELLEIDDKPFQFTKLEKKSPPNKPSQPTGPLVVCIDDSPQVCQMLEQILTRNGMRAVSVQDPIQALPKLIEHKPDLIFLDLVMPVASGYEICSQVRRISMFAETPVIILTGSDGLVDRVRAKVVGATEFISKPVVEDKVMGVIRKYLQQTSPANSTVN